MPRLTIAGIGGEAGSVYEEFWNKSDQREWIYDHPDWRERLQFDKNGLVVGPYLSDVLAGRWVPQKTCDVIFHGYHIPQTLFATIPLTIEDAVTKYRTSPMYSIEYQRKNNSQSFFVTNVLGQFYRSDARPVTREMILGCMTPYSYLQFSRPSEVLEYKELFGDRMKIAMGVDFGSGNTSSTVVAVIIRWTLGGGQKRLHLAYLERRPSENQLDQAEYICNLFKAYGCDIGMGDLDMAPYRSRQSKKADPTARQARCLGEWGLKNFLAVGRHQTRQCPSGYLMELPTSTAKDHQGLRWTSQAPSRGSSTCWRHAYSTQRFPEKALRSSLFRQRWRGTLIS
ncbi:MAG: hypothetical protein KGI25_00915 [Thaumarchaeota archaeon]|nr:hypothetical protein [Nitrososphaerota archaeon]